MAIKALVSEVDGGVSYSTIRRCLRLHKMRKWRLDAADAASKCTCVIFVGDVGSVLCIYGGEVRVVVGTVLRCLAQLRGPLAALSPLASWQAVSRGPLAVHHRRLLCRHTPRIPCGIPTRPHSPPACRTRRAGRGRWLGPTR